MEIIEHKNRGIEINFDEMFKGDTFDAIGITVKVDGVAIDLTNFTIKAAFKKLKTGAPVKEVTLGTGLSLASATKLTIESFEVDWQPAKYLFDIEFKSAAGRVKTYVWGSLPVEQDVTND